MPIFNEEMQLDGTMDFKDQCPDMHGYRTVFFKQVPLRKRIPLVTEHTSTPQDQLNSEYIVLMAAEGYTFIIMKTYASHCSQTIRWILVNPFWPYQGKSYFPFMKIHPYYLCMICKFFTWAYYYGITNFKKKPPPFEVSLKDAHKLQLVANFFGC